MEKVINEKDIKEANNIERCQIILAIIRGQITYAQDIKTQKGEMKNEEYKN